MKANIAEILRWWVSDALITKEMAVDRIIALIGKKQPDCGHPVQCIVSSDEGEYCGWCDDVNQATGLASEHYGKIIVEDDLRIEELEAEKCNALAVQDEAWKDVADDYLQQIEELEGELAAVDGSLGEFYCPVRDPETDEPSGAYYKDHGVNLAMQRLRQLEVQVEKMRAQLEYVQWVEDSEHGIYCPVCGQPPEQGHWDECALAKALFIPAPEREEVLWEGQMREAGSGPNEEYFESDEASLRIASSFIEIDEQLVTLRVTASEGSDGSD